jgi:hypothetical protein
MKYECALTGIHSSRVIFLTFILHPSSFILIGTVVHPIVAVAAEAHMLDSRLPVQT